MPSQEPLLGVAAGGAAALVPHVKFMEKPGCSVSIPLVIYRFSFYSVPFKPSSLGILLAALLLNKGTNIQETPVALLFLCQTSFLSPLR